MLPMHATRKTPAWTSVKQFLMFEQSVSPSSVAKPVDLSITDGWQLQRGSLIRL